jgi:hypothetical protein
MIYGSGWCCRQWIPDAGEAKTGEVGFIARGEPGYAMVSQGQREPRIEDNAASDIRLARQTLHFLHHAGSSTGWSINCQVGCWRNGWMMEIASAAPGGGVHALDSAVLGGTFRCLASRTEVWHRNAR